jgi:tungstate transport system substrate-binding protein
VSEAKRINSRYIFTGISLVLGSEENMKALTTTSIVLIAAIIIVAGVAGVYFLWPRPATQLIVSTTTSLYETGCLDQLKQRFEQTNPGYNVSFISQGTGKAIETAKLGEADMILVHAPTDAYEWGFLRDGYGVNRKIVAYNFFIIVGPTTDPAGIEGKLPLDALPMIKAAGEAGDAVWVSRGDGSGTHTKEKALWAAAGINYTEIRDESWYWEAGSGMAATLQLADQKDAYTLSDKASYLNNKQQGNIELIKLVEGGYDMLNVYSAIACNPQTLTNAKFDGAMAFIRFLISDDTQDFFSTFGLAEVGDVHFKPWIPILEGGSSEMKQWVETYAYLEGSECPTRFRYNAGDLYG